MNPFDWLIERFFGKRKELPGEEQSRMAKEDAEALRRERIARAIRIRENMIADLTVKINRAVKAKKRHSDLEAQRTQLRTEILEIEGRA